jgi:DNA-binding transcriptional LysR family regulator
MKRSQIADAGVVHFRHLRYFVVAAEERSFRKAACNLKVQASSVSRGIRDLEDGIGASLFHRRCHGVMLTEAGKSFLIGAQQVLASLERERRAVDLLARGREGRILIGVSGALDARFLINLLETFASQHRDVQLDFVDGPPERHVAWIRQGRLDIAFHPGMTEWVECDTAHLWSERVFVILPARHRLSIRRSIRWSDLMSEVFIVNDVGGLGLFHEQVLHRLRDLGHEATICRHAVDRETLLALVVLGQGICLATESMARSRTPGLVCRPLRQETVGFSAVWSPRNDNPALRRLLSLARRLASSELSPARHAPWRLGPAPGRHPA